jgi:PilZ domain
MPPFLFSGGFTSPARKSFVRVNQLATISVLMHLQGSTEADQMNKPINAAENQEPGKPKRGKNRDSLLVKAVLRFPNSKEEGEVRVRNISSGGLMAEAPVRTPRGEPVEVKLRNIGWVSGKVAWIAESRFGIAFDYPIDPKMTTQKTDTGFEIPRYLERLNQQDPSKKVRPL